MSATTTVTVTRSEEWIAAEQLRRGENLPVEIDCEVNCADLSEAARRILLQAGGGSYPKHFHGAFSHHRTFATPNDYKTGSMPIRVDADAPSTEQISQAIVAADAALAEERRVWKEEQAEAQRKREEEKRREREAEARLAEARKLLGGELQELRTAVTAAQQRRHTLSAFLAVIPKDALRGALKAAANSPEAIERLRNEIEEASSIYIFEDEDEEDVDQ